MGHLDNMTAEQMRSYNSDGTVNDPPANGHREVVARYPYHDADGQLLATKVRTRPKGFYWLNAAGTHGGVQSGGLPLYGLPKLLEAIIARRPIYLVDGEKDVETLRQAGEAATTPPTQEHWAQHHSAALANAKLVKVIRDRDENGHGQKRAGEIVAALKAANVAVELYEAPAPHKDITEMVEHGRGLDDLVRVLLPNRSMRRSAKSIETRSLRWIWNGFLARGYLTSQTGVEEAGKSSFTCWWSARLSRGELPGCEGAPKRVLIVATEDAIGDTWIPKLDLSDADLSMIDFFATDELSAGWNIRDGIDELRAAALEDGEPVDVIVFDSLLDQFPPAARGETANQPTFVRNALGPLKQLTRELDISTVFTMHPSKGKFGSFRDTVQMSQAFRAVVRLGLLVAAHPEDDENDQVRRRVVLRSKGNIGRDPGALEFKISVADFEFDDGVTQDVGYVRTVTASTVTARDLLATEKVRAQTKVDQAMTLIDNALNPRGEWKPAKPIRETLSLAGIASDDTVTTATKRLSVEKSNKPSVTGQFDDGSDSRWYWRMTMDTPEV
jgi:hypothetical protein